MAALAKTMTLLLVAMALHGVFLGAVYNVGDSAGWTIGHVDYQTWVSSKNFIVGDSLVFDYNNKFHNVKQVSEQDFETCNATSPIATHTTGSDTVTLKKLGNYYFLCGFQGHCEAGQRIQLVVGQPPRRPMPPTQLISDASASSEFTTFSFAIAFTALFC
ncbi:mavicyanin-like [Carica papaya]|uniref:mavicyanin-like n=1 Tax=Carica papaya TaxID=3649 RepID=UPI000B8CAB9B|nr:mavicyanin-like [Carica papaya]